MMPGIEMPEGYMSIAEAAREIGCSVPSLRRWDAEGFVVPERVQHGQHSVRAYSAGLVEEVKAKRENKQMWVWKLHAHRLNKKESE